MADFNNDNTKIETALHGLAEQAAGKADAAALAAAVSRVTALEDGKADKTALSAEQTARQNADNAEKAAREAAVAALTPKAGLQLIQTQTLDTSTDTFTFSFSDVDWTEWAVLYLCLVPVLSGGNPYVYIHLNGHSNSSGSSNCGCVLALFPMFSSQMTASGIFFGSAGITNPGGGALRFQGLHSVQYTCSSNCTMEAGTTIQLWGSR